MRLLCHPDTRAAAIASAEGTLDRGGGGLLRFRYRLRGDLAALRIPPPAAPERTDGLWRTTCFEAFIAGEDGAYIELNFSPSGAWAAYRFDAYRSGMAAADMPAPRIAVHRRGDLLQLTAEARLEIGDARRLGLFAVVEEHDGAKSYWAPAHPPGAPDFHHPSCFALELPPPA